jgi:hypothetical protein
VSLGGRKLSLVWKVQGVPLMETGSFLLFWRECGPFEGGRELSVVCEVHGARGGLLSDMKRFHTSTRIYDY